MLHGQNWTRNMAGPQALTFCTTGGERGDSGHSGAADLQTFSL